MKETTNSNIVVILSLNKLEDKQIQEARVMTETWNKAEATGKDHFN